MDWSLGTYKTYAQIGIVYMGAIASDADLPAVYSAGQVWEVGAYGVYKGHLCRRGDLLVAVNSSGTTEDEWADFAVFTSIDELDESLDRREYRTKVKPDPDPDQQKSKLDVISAIL